MSNQYPIHWLESIVKEIEARKPKQIVISAGKTPSGHIHLGILRELIIGDSLRRIFEKKGELVKFRIYFDSLDAAKRFPPYIDREFAKKYIGKPFALIPSPFKNTKAKSYAEYSVKDLMDALPEFGINIEPIWTHKLYKTKEMKNQIRIGLKNTEKVKKIVLEHITHSMKDEEKTERHEFYKNWMPAMVICENCGCTQKKLPDGIIKPNRVLSFNEKKDTVTYQCPACDYKGIVSVESGLLKLNWRLDWPAKWSLEPKNQFEGSGKDHYTKITGSWDVAVDLCKEIYKYEGPVGLGFEWLRLGDKDMGTSKGVVFMPKTYLTMVEPELLRMLILKTNPSRHISFRIEEISLLYDEFEKIERIFYGIEKAETDQMHKAIQFFYPLIRTKKISKLCPVQIPFKFLIIMAQLQDLLPIDSIIKKTQNFQVLKGINAKITKKYMKKRLDQTLNWLNYIKGLIQKEKDGKIKKKLMSKANFFRVSESITEDIKNQLNENQKRSLKKMADFLNSTDSLTEENLKSEMVKLQDLHEIKAKSLFQAIYLILIGVKRGPRLGPFLTLLDINWLRKRFSSI